MPLGTLLFMLAVYEVVFMLLAAYVAAQKHRAPAEGALLGLLFGLLGAIIEGLLPTVPE